MKGQKAEAFVLTLHRLYIFIVVALVVKNLVRCYHLFILLFELQLFPDIHNLRLVGHDCYIFAYRIDTWIHKLYGKSV
jgi:hypothetical protein